jgi:hypothetical protein
VREGRLLHLCVLCAIHTWLYDFTPRPIMNMNSFERAFA